MNTRITIITVVYNGVNTIEKTIKSVFAQTQNNIDFIIIDGGSEDGTKEIIEKYSDRLKHWESAPDKGIYDAMNKGWSAATDDSFILFLGSGDTILTLPDSEDDFSADVIYGKVILSENKIFNSSVNAKLRFGNTLHHQALLIKKSIHVAPPFSLKYRIYSDFDFNQRLYKRKVRFKYSDKLLAYALPDGVSSTYNYKESISVVRGNYGYFGAFLAIMFYAGQFISTNLRSK